MISITPEENSVQIDSIEETKVNRETNGKQEPNVIQMTNENQMEALHIAGETTNGERSESRQSGAEHPNEEKNSAEQGFCKTGPSESANKYKYAIFADWAGERYVSWILKLILPYALYRTWWAAVSHQAPDKTCYVGAAAIARQEKVGDRKIKIDLQELEARGLMERYRQRHNWPQTDGTIKYGTVTVKDFSRLYDLAYEYHLWINSPEYVEAEWDNAEEIKQDSRLCLKLMRFDNYRHILVCQKPGPKGKRTPLQEIYHCQLPEEDQGAQSARTSDLKGNLYLNPSVNVSSPYRESKNQESYVSKENSTSKEDLEEGFFGVSHTEDSLESLTIRNKEQNNQTETETEQQRTNKIEEEQPKRKEVRRSREQSNVIEIQQKEEMGREAAKEEKEYTVEELKQNPMTMIAFLLQLNEQERVKQEQEQAKNKKRHHKGQPKRKRRGTPERLARTITQMVQDLGGNPQYLQSDITRLTKLYWACTQIFHPFSNVWFLEQLTTAFVKTCKARKVGKRVPYFFKILEDILGLTHEELAYIRSQEPLYQDGDLKTFVLGLEQSYHRSGSQLEYQEWVRQTYL
jgi:hypothetical protein